MTSNDLLGALLFKEYGGGALVLLVGVFFLLTHCTGDGRKGAHNPPDKTKAVQHHTERHRYTER